jgi:hypothetical protein
MISGGTTTDRSPLSSLVTVSPIFDAAQTSTVATFVKGDTQSNKAAIANGNATFSVASTALNGIRVTMKNVGTGAFATAVSLYVTAVSNTAIIQLPGIVDAAISPATFPNGAHGLLTATNAPSFSNYPSIQAYVTGFTDITAGTTTTTGSTIAAVTTNRTGW